MSRRTRGVVPAAWMSKRPPSIGPVFRSTSGGWMTGPAFVSATSSASAQRRIAGKSSASRASTASVRDAGKTPVGRFAARTAALTSAGPVLRVRYGSVPVSASAPGMLPPARARPRASAMLPSVPGVNRTIWRSLTWGASRFASSSWLVAGSGAMRTSAPSTASARSVVARSRRALPCRPSANSMSVGSSRSGPSASFDRAQSLTRWPASARSAAVVNPPWLPPRTASLIEWRPRAGARRAARRDT